jgi:hypothetical protein
VHTRPDEARNAPLHKNALVAYGAAHEVTGVGRGCAGGGRAARRVCELHRERAGDGGRRGVRGVGHLRGGLNRLGGRRHEHRAGSVRGRPHHGGCTGTGRVGRLGIGRGRRGGRAGRGSATRAPAPPASWPPETTLTANREAWGIYLIVAKTYSAAENAKMQQVYRDLQGLGYRGYSGTLCDAGAENAGVDESADTVAVYFTTKAQAQQFVSGWNRPYVGYAQVATFCAS